MDITGATFNFTKTVNGDGENSSPEKPVDGDKEKTPKVAGDNKKNEESSGDKKNSITAFAYDLIKTGMKQTVSAVMSNVSGSATLQVQLQAAQQIGGKVIAYTAAIATGNWAAAAIMGVSDMISGISKRAEFERNKAWSDYDIEQYRERRGYSTMRNRR